MTSGQVFLWRNSDTGWVGRDGVHRYRVEVKSHGLEVEATADEAEFRRYFSLDRPFCEVFVRLAQAFPAMEEVVAGQAGLRLCQPHCAEETLFSFLCTANNHLARIESMVKKLEARGNGRFPSAQEIAAIPELELREAGFGYRAKTIVETARQLSSREPGWLSGLAEAPYPEAFRSLAELPGVGPKLADCICLYGLHHGKAVPVDTHLWQAACRHFFPEYAGGSLTERRYREIGDAFRSHFGELAGWAQLFLYFDNLERGRSKNRL